MIGRTHLKKQDFSNHTQNQKNMKNKNKKTELVVIVNQCGGKKGRGCEVEILPTMIRKAA